LKAERASFHFHGVDGSDHDRLVRRRRAWLTAFIQIGAEWWTAFVEGFRAFWLRCGDRRKRSNGCTNG